MKRVTTVWACVALAVLGACKTAPTDPQSSTTGAPDPAIAAPAPPPAPAAAPAPPLVTPLPADEIRAAIDSVRNQLDQGQEDSALELVRRILATDPNHRQANSYLKQIKEDPATLYAAESTPYRVVPGDTLASIALRFMKDRDQFYGLARYNDIRVPRQLQAGQLIKVPGRGSVPPAVAATGPGSTSAGPGSTSTGPGSTSAGPGATATPGPAVVAGPAPAAVPPPATASPANAQPAPASQAAASPPASPPPAPPVVNVKQQIDQCTREARRARERQEVCTAIARWTCVVQLDPSNKTAQAELERTVELKKKLPNEPC